jgi:hypothetical protein
MWRYSTGLVQALAKDKSLKEALHGYVVRIYAGAQPATADTAVNGTKLYELTLADGAFTGVASTRQIDNILIGSSTEGHTFVAEIAATSESYSYTALAGSSTSIVASALAELIDASPTVSAVASGANIIVRARFAGVAFVMTEGSDTGTMTFSTLTANARTNGLNWGSASDGVLSKESGTWSDTAEADGTAAWFRVCRYADAGGASTSEIRADGNCSTTTGDMVLRTLNIVTGDPLTLDTFNITIPKVRS